MREYKYIGSQAIIDNLPKESARICVHSVKDVLNWIKTTEQIPNYDNDYVATFIVSTDIKFWINDRHSEHVLCAAGQPVLSAGEVTFQVNKSTVEIVAITNQSTGYCPEPQSWRAVANASHKTQIPFPDNFTSTYIFRKCTQCGQKNIVKDDWYYCAVCDSKLSKTWNF